MNQSASRMERQSNFELLRIFAMLSVLAAHLVSHSGISPSTALGQCWMFLLVICGNLGLNTFILLSGYFLIQASSVRLTRALRIWLQMLFYSLLLFAVFTLSGAQPFGRMALFENLFPVSCSQWWFASDYLLFFLLSPFLNRLLCSLSRKDYLRFLWVLFLFWYLLPNLTNRSIDRGNLGIFLFLYTLAGYLRLHADLSRLRAGRCFGVTAAICLLAVLSYWALCAAAGRWSFLAPYAAGIYDLHALFLPVAAVLLFAGFSQLKISHCKPVNLVASATLGVYLLHEHPYMRPVIWHHLLPGTNVSGSLLLIPWSLLMICAVFAACTLVELGRVCLIERWYLGALNRFESRWNLLVEKLLLRLDRRP